MEDNACGIRFHMVYVQKDFKIRVKSLKYATVIPLPKAWKQIKIIYSLFGLTTTLDQAIIVIQCMLELKVSIFSSLLFFFAP